MMFRHALLAVVICSTATAVASDYVTHGVDPGRTGWIKDENVFTKANVGKMKLLWKVKLESTPREMHNLFNPLVLQNVTTAQGAREMAVVAGVSEATGRPAPSVRATLVDAVPAGDREFVDLARDLDELERSVRAAMRPADDHDASDPTGRRP